MTRDLFSIKKQVFLCFLFKGPGEEEIVRRKNRMLLRVPDEVCSVQGWCRRVLRGDVLENTLTPESAVGSDPASFIAQLHDAGYLSHPFCIADDN